MENLKIKCNLVTGFRFNYSAYVICLQVNFNKIGNHN
jgi:hypothetical protein